MGDPAAQTTVLDALAQRLARDPDGPYLDFEGVGLSARAVDTASGQIAAALRALGVGSGDRVATLLENSPEQVLSFFAALKLGAIQVPINTAYKGEFLRHQLVDSGARVLVVQGDFASRVAPVASTSLPELETVIVVGEPDQAIGGLAVRGWTALLDATPEMADPVPVGPADLACFIYTAGTTGPSKGCMLSQHYIVSLADQIAGPGSAAPTTWS